MIHLNLKGTVLKHLPLRASIINIIFFIALVVFSNISHAQSFSNSLLKNNNEATLITAQQDFLPPDQVFKPRIFKNSTDEISIIWEVNSDYYLYKNKIFVQPLNKDVVIIECHHDVVIYHQYHC